MILTGEPGNQAPKPATKYRLVISIAAEPATAVRLLRLALKCLLRSYGIRCIDIRPEGGEV